MIDAIEALTTDEIRAKLIEQNKSCSGNRQALIKRLMNNKNHFVFGYYGNKRAEFEYIYEKFRILEESKNIDTIYEPFCGTAAFSCILSTRFPKKYKYILNDNSPQLFALLNIIKNNKLQELIDECNRLMVGIDKQKYKQIINGDSIAGYIIKNKIYAITPGLFPSSKRFYNIDFNFMKDCQIVKFLTTEDIVITNNNINSISYEYNKENIFIFIDPPYISLNNDYYTETNINIYEYFHKNDLSSFKCRILLILNDNWVIKLLFNKYITNSFTKTYQTTKKKIQHLVITNYT